MIGKVRKLLATNRENIALGLCDGILNALTLASGKLTDSASAMSVELVVRVAIAGGASSLFMLFVTRYAQLRGELAEADRQLSLTSHGQQAASRLERRVRIESGIAAMIGGVAGFCGSLLPLLVGALVPGAPWIAIVVALALLAILGASLAMSVGGRPLLWASVLAISGAIIAYVGIRLDLI